MATADLSGRSLARRLAHLAQVLVGMVLLALGGAMVLTLLLLPVGLPLALAGMALMVADGAGGEARP